MPCLLGDTHTGERDMTDEQPTTIDEEADSGWGDSGWDDSGCGAGAEPVAAE